MIGGNVTNDFLDNLGANTYEKYFANHKQNKGIEITPETYQKMNEEFEEEGLAFRLSIPTQEQIDKWRTEK